MNLMQPVQILQTGMKALFDLDPTITEQLYHHSMSQITLVAALGIQIFKTISKRLPRQFGRSNTILRLIHAGRA